MTVYPAALAEHLDRELTSVCCCWRLTRKDGLVQGFTDHDLPVTVEGTLCEPQAGLSASEARATLGLSVDTMDVEGALSSPRLDEADIAAGLFDAATVETLLVNWREPQHFALLRKATIGRISCQDDRFVAELESLTHQLDRPGGRMINRTCDAAVGDGRCRFDLAAAGFQGAGTVESVEAQGMLKAGGLGGFAGGWFSHGTLTWTAGVAAGTTEHVADHRKDAAGVVLTLRPRAGLPITAGTTFTLTAGCDKKFGTCRTKFANTANFRGFPHLPGNDKAYQYAVEGDDFDGGPVVP